MLLSNKLDYSTYVTQYLTPNSYQVYIGLNITYTNNYLTRRPMLSIITEKPVYTTSKLLKLCVGLYKSCFLHIGFINLGSTKNYTDIPSFMRPLVFTVICDESCMKASTC